MDDICAPYIPPGEPSTGLTSSLLGVFDPTMLANDAYLLRAIGQDINGLWSEQIVQVNVQSEAKIGNFRYDADQQGCSECAASFADMEVDVAGIPIRIQRSYDSLDADQMGDFGYGWRMSITNPRLRESVRTSPSELAGAGPLTANPFRLGTRIYLNAPDGRRVGFTFDPIPEPGLLGTIWRPRFRPDAGVEYQLEVESVALSQSSDGAFGFYLLQLPYNPDRYTLVSKDQVRLRYSQFAAIQLESVTDRNGNTLTINEEGIFSSAGPAIRWERDTLNRITSITDPAGRSVRYLYDSAGDLIAFINQADEMTAMSYLSSPAHFLDTVTDSRGIAVMRLEYDKDRRIIGLRDGLGNNETRSYALHENQEIITDRLGYTTTLTFDDRGNIVQIVDAMGNVNSAEFNGQDKAVRLVDGRGFETKIEYDERGNQTAIVDSLGQTWSFNYTPTNELASTTDPNGNSTRMTYDANGNLLETEDQLGRRSSRKLDTLGRPIEVTNPVGHKWLFEYGAFETPTRIIHPDGNSREFTLDDNGSLVGMIDEAGTVYRIERDDAGREIAVWATNPNATANAGNRGSEIPLVPLTQRTFVGNLLTEQQDALGRITRYSYDAMGRLAAVVDP